MTRRRFDPWNVAGWVLASLVMLVTTVGLAGGFVALLVWSPLAFAVVASYATVFGLGVCAGRAKRLRLAFVAHFLGEEVEAVHAADLDADVAAERKLRLVDGDLDVPEFMADSGYRPPRHKENEDYPEWWLNGELSPYDCPEAGGCRREPECAESGCYWRRLDALNRPLTDERID